jgi:hypothetical protein
MGDGNAPPPDAGPDGEAPPDAPGLPMADVMAGMPGVWRRLLAAHVPDRLNRCTACRRAGGSGERWPCTLYRIASDARRLHDLELRRAVDAE